MQVPLTADHLAQGRPGIITMCAFALALAEATGLEWAVYPWPKDACAYTLSFLGDRSMRINLPDDVRDYVLDFDAGKQVQPRVFEIPDLKGG